MTFFMYKVALEWGVLRGLWFRSVTLIPQVVVYTQNGRILETFPTAMLYRESKSGG